MSPPTLDSPCLGLATVSRKEREKSYTFTLDNSTPSLGEFAGSKSTVQLLLRNFHGSKIRLTWRTKTIPGSPQFGICRTSQSHYRFSLSLKGSHRLPDQFSRWRGFQTAPSNPVSLFILSRSPYISLSNHLSPNDPSVIFCFYATPVGLGSLDLLLFYRPCRSQPI
ncbi:hypothetical protein TNCV_3812121 [Trichonephila clavipes]|nr:hypothetical protein TNCV_3812121 [Trichonephila clavipes]